MDDLLVIGGGMAGLSAALVAQRAGLQVTLLEQAEAFSEVGAGIQLGLADDFGSLDQVAREVVKAEDIIDYTQHENVASRLAKRFGAGVGESAMQLMQRAMPALR